MADITGDIQRAQKKRNTGSWQVTAAHVIWYAQELGANF